VRYRAIEVRPCIRETGSVREAVPGRYALDRDGTVPFALGPDDRERALVIDPVLVYATYLGGGQGRGICEPAGR
jgi:hypothetical protein